ncbi:hypothetical protein TeGR_g5393 [Tetraparma gracilis]|uniref:Translocon-associated protein subunit alpha n=1 Tax=Tetraparma gracilis TaxID=2962635 RepID=A0ABQ6N097_9STRA|nr:hypothetical protein TeGR_g5393 [Tetraparma gracilis]
MSPSSTPTPGVLLPPSGASPFLVKGPAEAVRAYLAGKCSRAPPLPFEARVPVESAVLSARGALVSFVTLVPLPAAGRRAAVLVSPGYSSEPLDLAGLFGSLTFPADGVEIEPAPHPDVQHFLTTLVCCLSLLLAVMLAFEVKSLATKSKSKAQSLSKEAHTALSRAKSSVSAPPPPAPPLSYEEAVLIRCRSSERAPGAEPGAGGAVRRGGRTVGRVFAAAGGLREDLFLATVRKRAMGEPAGEWGGVEVEVGGVRGVVEGAGGVEREWPAEKEEGGGEEESKAESKAERQAKKLEEMQAKLDAMNARKAQRAAGQE